jgi:MFS family permease
LLLVVFRGALAAGGTAWWNIALVQLMEGVSMGLAGVAIPALAADIMADTGHAGGGLGIVMMAYGAGAALSPGLVAQKFGFPAAFISMEPLQQSDLHFGSSGCKQSGMLKVERKS